MGAADKLTALLTTVRALLQGETVRVITYGAVVVVWLVTHVGYWLGWLHNQPPSLDATLLVVSAAVVAINEAIRQFVFSAATVAVIQATAAAAGVQAAGSGEATVTTTTAPAITTTVTTSPPDPTSSQPAQDVQVDGG